MADIDIPQAEADALIAMDTQCVENKLWLFPEPGGRGEHSGEAGS